MTGSGVVQISQQIPLDQVPLDAELWEFTKQKKEAELLTYQCDLLSYQLELLSLKRPNESGADVIAITIVEGKNLHALAPDVFEQVKISIIYGGDRSTALVTPPSNLQSPDWKRNRMEIPIRELEAKSTVTVELSGVSGIILGTVEMNMALFLLPPGGVMDKYIWLSSPEGLRPGSSLRLHLQRKSPGEQSSLIAEREDQIKELSSKVQHLRAAKGHGLPPLTYAAYSTMVAEIERRLCYEIEDLRLTGGQNLLQIGYNGAQTPQGLLVHTEDRAAKVEELFATINAKNSIIRELEDTLALTNNKGPQQVVLELAQRLEEREATLNHLRSGLPPLTLSTLLIDQSNVINTLLSQLHRALGTISESNIKIERLMGHLQRWSSLPNVGETQKLERQIAELELELQERDKLLSRWADEKVSRNPEASYQDITLQHHVRDQTVELCKQYNGVLQTLADTLSIIETGDDSSMGKYLNRLPDGVDEREVKFKGLDNFYIVGDTIQSVSSKLKEAMRVLVNGVNENIDGKGRKSSKRDRKELERRNKELESMFANLQQSQSPEFLELLRTSTMDTDVDKLRKKLHRKEQEIQDGLRERDRLNTEVRELRDLVTKLKLSRDNALDDLMRDTVKRYEEELATLRDRDYAGSVNQKTIAQRDELIKDACQELMSILPQDTQQRLSRLPLPNRLIAVVDATIHGASSNVQHGVKIKLLEARDMDPSNESHVQATIGPHRHRSSSKPANRGDPQWNDSFTVPWTSIVDHDLQVSVFGDNNSALGQANINLSTLPPEGCDLWLPIISGRKQNGMIHVSCEHTTVPKSGQGESRLEDSGLDQHDVAYLSTKLERTAQLLILDGRHEPPPHSPPSVGYLRKLADHLFGVAKSLYREREDLRQLNVRRNSDADDARRGRTRHQESRVTPQIQPLALDNKEFSDAKLWFMMKSRTSLVRRVWAALLACKKCQQSITHHSDVFSQNRGHKMELGMFKYALDEVNDSVASINEAESSLRWIISNYFTEQEKLDLGTSPSLFVAEDKGGKTLPGLIDSMDLIRARELAEREENRQYQPKPRTSPRARTPSPSRFRRQLENAHLKVLDADEEKIHPDAGYTPGQALLTYGTTH